MYIHERKDWPHFTWNKETVLQLLADTRFNQGKLLGRMKSLGFKLQEEASLQILTEEVVKSSAIEGETLPPAQVRSSIARRLGLNIAGLVPADRNVEGVVQMMVDATQKFNSALTVKRLFGWHTALFPTGKSGNYDITVGNWRTKDEDPMQVLSGPLGRERVHFEAPVALRLENEMDKFLEWFNKFNDIDPLLKSALAHLWFVTIHPFGDGNGRIARAIADMQLARSDSSDQRFYSMSSQIQKEREMYYECLEKTQKNNMDITRWLVWFLECLNRAIAAAEEKLSHVLAKSSFWEKHSSAVLNERQRKMINKILDNEFEGKLTSTKWTKMNKKCSPDTALRDINDLIRQDILEKEPGGGRSTSYRLIV